MNMNKWAVRLAGLLLLLMFLIVFAQMYNTLRRIQQQQGSSAPAR
jgi:hypothetical protein